MKELKMYQQPGAVDTGMLEVAVGPHCRMGKGIAQVYQRWVVALLPAVLGSIYYFGTGSLRIFGLCVTFAVALDYLAERLAPSRDLTSNWSSVMYGLMLGFMMPVNSPWWLVLTGCFCMVIVGKKLFGGVGGFPVHPAVLSVAILQLSWPGRMDNTGALKDLDWQVVLVEPLRLLKSLGASAESSYDWLDMFLGRQVAGTAEGMVFLVIIGGLLLLVLREIQYQAVAGFLTGLVATASLLHFLSPEVFATPQFYLLSGGTVFMGLFLITDHTTSPVNRVPLFLYGLLAGVLLICIRGFSKHADGIAYAVLLVNICAPLLDMIRPKVRGGENV